MVSPYRRSKVNIRKGPRRKTRARSYTKPRRTSTKKRTRCVCPGELTPSARFALAQLDPFHPATLGAKVPDTNTMPSLANSSSDQVTCPLATTGFLTGFAFRPNYNQAVINATPVSATAVSWGANPAANALNRRDITAFIAQMEAVRPVAHAIRIVSQLAPTSASGFVHIGLSVESQFGNNPSTWQFPTTVNEMTGLAHYRRVTLASLTQSPLTVINKWIDERGFNYQDPGQVNTSSTGTSSEVVSPFGWSWCNIVVLVEGAPATPSPLSAEHLLLTESLPQKTSILIGTAAAPNSPGTMSAVSQMVGENDFTHTESGQESYISQGLNAFARGAATAGEQVYNNVAAPLLQRAGYAAGMTASQMAFNAMTGRGGLSGINANPNRLGL